MKLLWFPFQILFFLYSASVLVVLILLGYPLALLFCLFPEPGRDRAMYHLLRVICFTWFLFSGIIPVTYHRRKQSFNRRTIFIMNHQSFIDAANLYTAFPVLFKTLGKTGIEKVPFYGVMYKAVVIRVDRSSLHARALSYRNMRKALQGGTAIALFPEGTFPDEHQINMLPFRDGSFTLAVDEACALHPVLFPDSSYRMHPKQVWRITPGINRLIFLPPLHGAGLVKKDIPQWSTYVRSYMQACLNYTRTHSPQGVWEYALQWLQKHTFEPA